MCLGFKMKKIPVLLFKTCENLMTTSPMESDDQKAQKEEKTWEQDFYLVIVRKHTKVKHLRLFQLCADDCVSDQVL
jgi:hypothetical protein